jgi:hypothetical protein
MLICVLAEHTGRAQATVREVPHSSATRTQRLVGPPLQRYLISVIFSLRLKALAASAQPRIRWPDILPLLPSELLWRLDREAAIACQILMPLAFSPVYPPQHDLFFSDEEVPIS